MQHHGEARAPRDGDWELGGVLCRGPGVSVCPWWAGDGQGPCGSGCWGEGSGPFFSASQSEHLQGHLEDGTLWGQLALPYKA